MTGQTGYPGDIEISDDGRTATAMLHMLHPGELLIDRFTLEDLDATRALIKDEATRRELARFFAIVQTVTWPGYDDVEIDEVANAALELESETLAELEELARSPEQDRDDVPSLHKLALWTDVARVMREFPLPVAISIEDFADDNPQLPELMELLMRIVEARDGEPDDGLNE
jgi:hypothetical protein